jgi:hypothetical protein
MITFTQLGALGRLGNQLFQYAALRGVASMTDLPLKIPDPATKKWHGQDCFLDRLSLECEYLDEEDYKKIQYQYREPNYMAFNDDVFRVPSNTDLYGFFQSTCYFEHCKEQIKRELTPKSEYMEKAQETIGELKAQHLGHEIISLHLRRGDNTDGSNPSGPLNNMYGANNEFDLSSPYGRFFAAAMVKFRHRKAKFLVFTGGSRSEGNSNHKDMEWCKRTFVGDQYVFSDEVDAFGDFCLIMSCDHNIISPVSSFGWWAAYLNPSPGKTVAAPRKYDPSQNTIDYRDGFYPPEWEKL